jgi:hypothetical protein
MASPCLSCGYVCIILVRLCALNLYVIIIVGLSPPFLFFPFFFPLRLVLTIRWAVLVS